MLKKVIKQEADPLATDDVRSQQSLREAADEAYPRSTGRWITVIAIVIGFGLAAAFVEVTRIKARESDALEQDTRKAVAMLPLVDVATAKAGQTFRSLFLPGDTAAWYRTTLYSRVNGYLAEWKVDIGDKVKKGQLLATIDTPDLDSQLVAARAELEAAKAEAKVRQADADFARSSYDRWRDSPKGVVSDQEREEKKAANDSSIAKLNAATAQVAVDQAKVDGLMTLTQFKNVTAPFNGIITERRVDPGDLVTAGSSANTSPLFVIQQTDKIRIFVRVPQNVAGNLSIGSTVEVTTDGGSGRSYEGKIVRTTGAVDPRARTMLVEVVLPNANYALSPGMYVRTNFQVAQSPSVEVPAAAILFRGKGPQVAVVEDGKIKFKNVAIASDDGEKVELASGIDIGDRVALNINGQISDGDRVAINNDSSGAQS
ncbi:efflux RND transporter periplasmic adaptor subunit [Hyphomicrobium sp.]|jgi:RND family efflux transporter MFP subunit|uniref:efflux RND transporter periplasmic adaptor subunit n=1 Tax=Hyphomicrobium sp. TaxID=82 RepID=UPI0035634F53